MLVPFWASLPGGISQVKWITPGEYQNMEITLCEACHIPDRAGQTVFTPEILGDTARGAKRFQKSRRGNRP